MDRSHSSQPFRREGPEARIVTGVHRAEDGWDIEVEDARGVRLTYWIAGTSDCVPHVGDTARFYGGASGEPLHGVEINGFHVPFDDHGEAAD